MSSVLMDQWYIFKMSLNRNSCETRLCIYQLTKMWPDVCRNLTVFPLRTVVQYLLIRSSQQLYRPWLLQIVKFTVCICICLGKRLAENRMTCTNSYEWLLLSLVSIFLYWVLTTSEIWWYIHITYSFWKLKFPLSKHNLSPRYYPSKCP